MSSALILPFLWWTNADWEGDGDEAKSEGGSDSMDCGLEWESVEGTLVAEEDEWW